MNQFFDTIGGLPLHPLTVHAASVLIPLSAIALVLLVFVPKWRKAYLPLTIGSLAMSVGLAFAAKQSGEALAARVGNPGEHQALGDLMLPASIGLFFLGLAFYFFTKTEKPKWTLQLAGALSTAAVVGVVVLSVLVGHSGAQATWGDRISANQAEELPAPTEPTPGATTDSGISVAEVQKHNTAKDCWTVVNGNVYDLTSYIAKHKGGSAVLTAICGKDGTKAFSGQHAGASKPNADLSSLLLGPLAGSTTGSGSGTTKPTPGASADTGVSVAEVQKHNTAKDCWTVVNGNVYDLTSYIARHKGGSAVLTAICGKDGTKAFSGQHAGASKPNADLSSLLVGPLAGSTTGSGSSGTNGAAGTPAVGALTAAEVLKHSTGTDCWSVINGEVYDLTSYVTGHPGGANLIKAICGKDGSSSFASQHAGASKPNNILAAFALGPLVKGSTLPEATVRGEEDDD